MKILLALCLRSLYSEYMSVSARFLCLLKKSRKVLFVSIFSLLIVWVFVLSTFPSLVNAQTTGNWVEDPEVTLVGKAAERARQLLWWTIRNPGVYTAPVLAEYWSISRNIVYVFTLLVIVMFGFSYILLRRRASMSTITPIIFKIAFVLLFATLSYVILLGLIQFSEIGMRFFIEQVGGRDLFNVIFSGGPNQGRDPFESNYYNFIGFREISPANQEMVQTSLFLIRFTTFTYYIMSIMLILRTIILWFLLVLSPFLVVLVPFVFIRNTGLIWIGVFFQWLFYGPLVAIFLGAITKIWVKGIPFPFDFSRAGKVNGQIYKTSINILYGGPAQQLGPANSANYVDTFAEYVIALIMLWTAIVLPWLLLRIFRDYCCIAIAAGNATLTAIYDRLRQYPPSAPPPAPSGSSTGNAVDLPFRQNINQSVDIAAPERLEMIKEIEKTNTEELTKTLNLSVSRLSDISRIETNQYAQSQIKQQLATLASPESAASVSEKERFTLLRQELQSRAASGDRQARILLNASGHRNENISASVNVIIENRNARVQSREVIREREIEREKGAIREKSEKSYRNTVSDMVRLNPNIVREIAGSAQVSESAVSNILQSVSAGSNMVSNEKVATLSREQSVSEEKIKEIVSAAQSKTEIIAAAPSVSEIASRVNLSEGTITNVLANLPTNQIIDTGLVSQVALKTGISPEKVEEIYQNAQPAEPIDLSAGSSPTPEINDANDISKKVTVEKKSVENILQNLPVTNAISNEMIQAISALTGVSSQIVEQIYKSAVGTSGIPSPSVIAKKVGASESVVIFVLITIPKLENVSQSVIEKIASKTNTTVENVKSVYEKTQIPVTFTPVSLVHLNDASTISHKLNIDQKTVENILEKIPVTEVISNELVGNISQSTGVASTVVEEIYRNAVGTQTVPSVSTIAEKVKTSESVVAAVLPLIPKQQEVKESVIEKIASETNTTKENVSAVYRQTQTSIQEAIPQMAPAVAEKLHLEKEKVGKVLSVLPSWGTPSYAVILKAAHQSGLSVDKVKNIAKIASVSMLGSTKKSIDEIIEASGESETIVSTVLEALPKAGYPTPSRMADAAQKAGISEARVKAIVTASHTTSTKSTAGGIASTISLEDYEEVKRMWLNHYRSAPVPVNETIKDRNGWLAHEEKKLQEVSELISSQDAKVKEKGLEKVSEILPFLLLGGFSDAEILTYLKAKKEAARQVTDELVVASTTREETVKKISSEDESTMVGVSEKKEATVSVSDTLSESFRDEERSTSSDVISSWTQKISALPTHEIASNLNLVVSHITDIARPEIEKGKAVEAIKNLNHISSPAKIPDTDARANFENIRKELETRATAGDVIAQRILTASNNPPSDVTPAASFILVSNRKSGGVSPEKKSVGFSIFERALKDPSVTPYLAVKNSIPEPLVYQVIEFIALGGEVTEEKLTNISERVHLPLPMVKNIISGAAELLQINALSPSDIAQRISLPISTVKAVLEKIPTDHTMTPSEQEELAKSANVSIIQMMSIDEFAHQPLEKYAGSLVPFLAERYSVPDSTIHALFRTVPAYTILTPEKIEDIGNQLDVKPVILKQILQTVDESFILNSDPFVIEIAKKTGEPLKIVKGVIETIPEGAMLESSKCDSLAKEMEVTPGRVQKIEKVREAQKKNSELLALSVSISDYEEVKNMWLNHYNNSPVPQSEKIKNRYSWLLEEENQIQSVSELLSSTDSKEKQKGLEGISEILPFILLGGFSDVEILTYLKAKYQAARTVRLSLSNKSDLPPDASVIVVNKNINSPLPDINAGQSKEIPLPEAAGTLGEPAITAIIDKGPVKKDSLT